MQFDFGSTRHNHSYSPITMGSEYTIKQEINKCYVNGVENTFTREDVTYTYPLYLFALNSGGTITSNSNATKISYERFYKDGIDLANFVPCKHKVGGVEQCGMLDLVNVVFYPNAGTGQFTIPDISYTPSTP